jgi:hypothetical protein
MRLARGCLPWPNSATAPAARGSLTTEQAIDSGARLRITCWARTGPDGSVWLSVELEPYPPGGRPRTATDNHVSEQETER